MANNSDQKDNETKLDRPRLSLKTHSTRRTSKGKKFGPPHSQEIRSNRTIAKNEHATATNSKHKVVSRKKTQKNKLGNNKRSGTMELQSRQIVFDILTIVEEGGQLDKALNAHAELPKLDSRDRRFVQLLATTYLRRCGQLKKILTPLMTRRPFGNQSEANIILLMGATQLLFLKTGAHAAVNSTVELMRKNGFERLCGLANAVMRRIAREGETIVANTDITDNLPDWLKLSWQHYWGDEATNVIAKLAMLPPPLDVTVAKDPEFWAKKLDGKLFCDNTIRREFAGDPTLLDGFADGAWWVQDAAAAMPARLLGQLKDKTVIDLCAAPGGKTAQLISAGANVTAVDNNRKRLDRLQRNLKRLKMQAEFVLSDGRTYLPNEPVDSILLDAPCSATGTIRRRPDILGRRSGSNMRTLQAVQWELATTALGWLKPGGQMVYATCSLQPEEGEDIISAILQSADGRYELAPITVAESGLFSRSITDNGCLRIMPNSYLDIGGVDGFFVARLICVI